MKRCGAVLLAAMLPAQQPAPVPVAAVAPIDVGSQLRPLLAQHHVPALGVAVILDGELHALGVAGVRKQGDPTEVTVDDRWHLGSCTKAMTATLLARLVAAGKLQWTTPIADGLPALAAAMHADARAISLEQLLSHRSGLPANPPRALWREVERGAATTREQRLQIAEALLAAAPAHAPGTHYEYSNAGYMLAGAIAERVADRSWEQLMQEQVFAPLGMQSAGFGPPGRADAVEQPYAHKPGEPPLPIAPGRGADNPPALGPAGTVHCTLADWARFARLQLGCGDGEQRLLEGKALAELQRPRGDGYALGWAVTTRPWANGPVLSHSGSNTVWFCVAWLAPAERFGVLVTCNCGDAAKACDAVAAAMIRRFHPRASPAVK